ncbi:MAG TPA: SRPBCC domain-containing protein [Streptosporangiaceae bacterium]|nr:SRPBCC domain-containing protein [Streptosporangiaceae bacterium]
MELEHSFTVPVPKSRAWDVLLDVERVAPCMPGATLDSVDGDEIRGRIKVKVGPINMVYAGTARFIERDEETGTVTLEASGKETRGAGTASASVKSVLEDRGTETHVTVLTTLNVTGKPAQFGRGVMNEVGGRLLNMFATNLAATLAQDDGGGTAGAAVAGGAAAGTGGTATATSAANGTGPAGPSSQAANGTTAAAAKPSADSSIDDLKLPARTTSSLRKDGISTVSQLAAKSEEELLAIDGIGPASVDDIRAKLSGLGFALGQPQAAPPAAQAQAPASVATSGAAATPAPAAAGAVSHASAARHAAHQLEEDAINLFKVAGMPVLKRAVPVLAGVIAALFIGLRARARRRKR